VFGGDRLKLVSVSQQEYGEDIDRVRDLFADGKPHLPKEATKISQYGYKHILALFQRGILLRTRDQLNYNHVETHGKKAKWCRIRGYAYIKADSKLLGPNNTLEWEFPQTERWTHITTMKKQLLSFINYEESKVLQKDHYKRMLSKAKITEYFEKRGMGATTRTIAKGLGLGGVKVRLSSLLAEMVAEGTLVRMGKWNPILGHETIFRGKLHGYVYALDHEQCKMFIQSGEVLSQEANAMLKEVIKNSNEKRLTPLYIFANSPYNFDSKIVSYNADNLKNTFKNIEKIVSNEQVFLYVKDKMTEEDVKRSIEYWDRKLSLKKSFSVTIGAMHERVVQICLDEMGNELDFDWQFQRVIRRDRISYQIRIGTGSEIDRVLMVTMDPLGIKHYFPIEAKYRRSGMVLSHIQEFYDILCRSKEFGCSIEFEGKQVRVLKADTTPILVSPFFTKEARNWAWKHGMVVLPTWMLTKYYAEKKELKRIELKKLTKEYLERPNKNMTIDQFLKVKLSR